MSENSKLKNILILTGITLLLVLLQGSLFQTLFGARYNPNLIIALSFTFFYAGKDELAQITGFVGGLFLDVLGFSIIGISPLLIVGFLLIFSFVRRHLTRGWVLNLFGVCASTFVYLVLVHGGASNLNFSYLSSLTTLVTSLILYVLLSRTRSITASSSYVLKR